MPLIVYIVGLPLTIYGVIMYIKEIKMSSRNIAADFLFVLYNLIIVYLMFFYK